MAVISFAQVSSPTAYPEFRRHFLEHCRDGRSPRKEQLNKEPMKPGKGHNMTLAHEELTGQIIGAAIAVHKTLGPGFLEAIYENALAIELRH
jgi:hypothetical protein